MPNQWLGNAGYGTTNTGYGTTPIGCKGGSRYVDGGIQKFNRKGT